MYLEDGRNDRGSRSILAQETPRKEMQTLLLLPPPPRPAVSSRGLVVAPSTTPPPSTPRLFRTPTPSNLHSLGSPFFLPARSPSSYSLIPFALSAPALLERKNRTVALALRASTSAFSTTSHDESEKAKLAQVSKRLESTSRCFRRLGSLGFWGQLVCTIVAAVILSFSIVATGKITSPATFYATAGSIAAAFVSVFWSFGYIRLSERLRRTASEPAKAPPRAEVVKSLKNAITINILGMGAAILGMQATVGLLVAKALTSSVIPYYQGISPGQSPVVALDVFLVQASANTILSHFLGLVLSLELLRYVTIPNTEAIPIPRAA